MERQKDKSQREFLEKFVILCNSFFRELFCAYDEEHSQRVGRAR